MRIKILIMALCLLLVPIHGRTAEVFVVPAYDGSLAWESNVDSLLRQIYDDLQSLVRPAEGRTSSKFGLRKHPILGIKKHHNGMDIACGVGTPVKSVLGGTVVYAGKYGAYGNMVEVQHAVTGLKSRYAHLSKVLVEKDQHVERGEVIARSGNTGFSTGPHLHFELFEAGQVVDPEKLLQGGAVAALPRL
jgi:murein DD-endopeptidase MepM/ murein hydrolase activator NlpD